MSIQEVVKYGSEVLRKPCKAVTKFDKKLQKLVNDMFETMYSTNGVGLAAPQVGENLRVLVIDVDYGSERYDESGNPSGKTEDYNPLVLINPVIVYKEGEVESYEGCLSFPDVFFAVKRARKIVVKFQNLSGKEERIEAEEDLLCRCIQHEIDHLDGKLFIDIAIDKQIAQKELDDHGFKGVNSSPSSIFLT